LRKSRAMTLLLRHRPRSRREELRRG
jgi:hypothetical protein